MNRLLYKTFFLAALVLIALSVPSVQVRAAGLTLKQGSQEFVIPQSLISSWGGKFSLPQSSSLLMRPRPLEAYIADYLGLDQKLSPISKGYNYDPAQVYAWVQTLSEKVNQPPVEPKLTESDGRVTDFTPPQTGLSLDVYQSSLNVLSALETKSTEAKLAVEESQPVTSLSGTNDLGINELIGEGVSNFSGSPANRIHNIKTGIEKLKNTLIQPGAEFSFNENICPVDKSGGYLPELVILGDKGTVPEYGGGLCQVSSTLFRAVMNSGLAIVQRKNHSYAVKYYAPQGSDATTYCGGIDFKFLNDTPGSILVWPEIKSDGHTLVFQFYGTRDDRQITVDTPIQYDKKADGSMKATWTRTVTNNGKTNQDVFKSVYLPPALFHKPEAVPEPPPATTTPPAGNERSPAAGTQVPVQTN